MSIEVRHYPGDGYVSIGANMWIRREEKIAMDEELAEHRERKMKIFGNKNIEAFAKGLNIALDAQGEIELRDGRGGGYTSSLDPQQRKAGRDAMSSQIDPWSGSLPENRRLNTLSLDNGKRGKAFDKLRRFLGDRIRGGDDRRACDSAIEELLGALEEPDDDQQPGEDGEVMDPGRRAVLAGDSRRGIGMDGVPRGFGRSLASAEAELAALCPGMKPLIRS